MSASVGLSRSTTSPRLPTIPRRRLSQPYLCTRGKARSGPCLPAAESRHNGRRLALIVTRAGTWLAARLRLPSNRRALDSPIPDRGKDP